MKQLSKVLFLVSVVSCLWGQAVWAGERAAEWQENVPNLMILYDYESHGMFEFYYNGEYLPHADQFMRFEKVHLLMVNGGFVPHSKIIIKNDCAMVPASIIENVFNATVDSSRVEDPDRAIEITVSDITIVFYMSMGYMEINGARQDIDATPFYRNSEIYLPLRLIADVIDADIQYKENFLFLYEQKMPTHRSELLIDLAYFDIITVETQHKDREAFTVEEGIQLLKDAAVEMYGQTHIASGISRDYDMHDITYTGHDLGRYYIYVVNGLENEPIFLNKYTGELFSSPGGSIPYFLIIEGFLNKPAN